MAALRAHRTRQLEERLVWGAAWQDTGLVFTQKNGALIGPNWLSKRFRRLIQGPPPIRFHALRHTWATLSLRAGVERWAVADIAGHSSVSETTACHAIPAKLRDASAKVAALIFER